MFEQFAFDPQPAGSTTTSVHALMNSPSVTGAYHFKITPGEPTIFEVHAVVYPRRDDITLGLRALFVDVLVRTELIAQVAGLPPARA